MTPTTLAIVRDGLKYIQYHGVWDIEELYDLKADPLELTNLINTLTTTISVRHCEKRCMRRRKVPRDKMPFPTRRDWLKV